MAIVWSYQDPNDQTRYQVRSAGSSLRLYTNGAFHSQYSPKHLFTGAVWDLLSIPVLLKKHTKPSQNTASNILMLGVGGGSAIHQLNTLLHPKEIVGIEVNPIHIHVAQKHFGLNAKNINLHEADAFAWVNQCRRKFDVIIDDLFLDAPDDPVRPFEPGLKWVKKLESRLTTHGMLIQNHLSLDSARQVADLAAGFSTALLFSTPQYENVVLALYREPPTGKAYTRQIKTIVAATQLKSSGKLRFNIRKLR